MHKPDLRASEIVIALSALDESGLGEIMQAVSRYYPGCLPAASFCAVCSSMLEVLRKQLLDELDHADIMSCA